MVLARCDDGQLGSFQPPGTGGCGQQVVSRTPRPVPLRFPGAQRYDLHI